MPNGIRLMTFLAAGLMAALPSQSALSQQGQVAACGERSEFVQHLKQRYGEQPVARGLMSGGVITEIFAAPGGTWTMLITTANGKSCLVGVGEAWQASTVLAGDDV